MLVKHSVRYYLRVCSTICILVFYYINDYPPPLRICLLSALSSLKVLSQGSHLNREPQEWQIFRWSSSWNKPIKGIHIFALINIIRCPPGVILKKKNSFPLFYKMIFFPQVRLIFPFFYRYSTSSPLYSHFFLINFLTFSPTKTNLMIVHQLRLNMIRTFLFPSQSFPSIFSYFSLSFSFPL